MNVLATEPMCAHCELAAETVKAVRAENEQLRAELIDFRLAKRRRDERLRSAPEVEPRSGWDFVMALKDRGLSVYDRDGRGAKRWMCGCPAHSDRHGSLSVTELSDGKVLLRCWAGCDTEQVLDAIGWSFAHLRGRG